MLRDSTRYFADLKSVGTEVRINCQMPCIKSILEVNRDARSSAALFQTLVADDYLISAFPSMFLSSVHDLSSVNRALSPCEVQSPPGNGSSLLRRESL